MVGCPMMCTFCPQDKLIKSYDGVKYMTSEAFDVILSKLPTFVRVDFSGMSEPWANPHATDMLDRALSAGHNVAVYSTLQGMSDPERVVDLLVGHRDQVEKVVVHLPDEWGNMRGFSDTPEYRAALTAITVASPRLRDVSFMTMGAGWTGGLTRAGNLDLRHIKQQPVEETPNHATPLTCSFTPFYDHNVVLPNGDVVLCCMDYSVKHRIGNLLEQDYYDLFASRAMNNLRVANMNYGDDNSLCRKCSRARPLDLPSHSNQFWEETKVLNVGKEHV